MAKKKEAKSSWFVHVDLTAVSLVIALVVGALVVRYYFKKMHEDEVASAERARTEREKKESELAAMRHAESLILQAERIKKEQEGKLENDRRIEEKRQRRAMAEQTARELAKQREDELEKERLARARDMAAMEDRERKKRLEELEMIGRDRQRMIDDAQSTVLAAAKQIEEATKTIATLRGKMIAFKNRMQYSLKQSDANERAISQMASQHGKSTTITTGRVIVDLSDEIINLASKNESVSKEFRDSAAGYNLAHAELVRAEGAIAEINFRRDQALELLKKSDVLPATAGKKTLTVVSKPLAEQPKKIYVMKDGRRIVAVRAMEADDTISIKKTDGQFESVNKSDVDKVETEM